MSTPKPAFGKFPHHYLLVPFIALILVISCRKIDQIVAREKPIVTPETRFFTEHVPKDTLVKSVLGFVKRENEKHQFVNNQIKKIGYPYWDKAIVKQGGSSSNGRSTSDSTNTVFIPFVLDNANTVNNTLIVIINPSDTNFLLLADWQYADQSFGPPSVDSTAENVALLFMMEDKNVFGYDRFTITDSNLFRTIATSPNYNGREIRFPASNARTMLEYEVEVCFNTYSCPYPWDCRFGCDYLTGCIADDEPYCQLIVSVCWYYTYDVGMGQWSTGGGGGPEGGGGAGGGWNSWDPPICEEEPQGRSTTYQDCGPGWTPPGINVPVEASQAYKDSLIAEDLKRLVTKMQNKPDSIYNAAQQNNSERCFTLEKINGDTIVSWIRVGNARSSSPLLTNAAFGFAHTHQQDVPITNADLNQCFDGADIYKIYKNTCVDGYNLNLSFLITKDYYYAFVITDQSKFKKHIDSTISNSKNIYVIQDKIDSIHVAAWDNCTGCSWQTGSERGTLAVTANNNETISGVRVFRSPRQNINFTLLTQ